MPFNEICPRTRSAAPVPGKAQRSGLTLMEVLVSMLVMALGLLGMAALQTNTMKYQLGSKERASLSILLADYAERVRANLSQAPGAVSGSKYLLVDAADATAPQYTWDNLSANAPVTAGKDCSGSTSCTAAERAEYDMAQWLGTVRARLPQGSAVVSGTAATGLLVTFVWRDKDFTGQSATCAATNKGLTEESCCPSSVGANGKAGVRCANFTVMP